MYTINSKKHQVQYYKIPTFSLYNFQVRKPEAPTISNIFRPTISFSKSHHKLFGEGQFKCELIGSAPDPFHDRISETSNQISNSFIYLVKLTEV